VVLLSVFCAITVPTASAAPSPIAPESEPEPAPTEICAASVAETASALSPFTVTVPPVMWAVVEFCVVL
jgi:hypothetical protein